MGLELGIWPPSRVQVIHRAILYSYHIYTPSPLARSVMLTRTNLRILVLVLVDHHPEIKDSDRRIVISIAINLSSLNLFNPTSRAHHPDPASHPCKRNLPSPKVNQLSHNP